MANKTHQRSPRRYRQRFLVTILLVLLVLLKYAIAIMCTKGWLISQTVFHSYFYMPHFSTFTSSLPIVLLVSSLIAFHISFISISFNNFGLILFHFPKELWQCLLNTAEARYVCFYPDHIVCLCLPICFDYIFCINFLMFYYFLLIMIALLPYMHYIYYTYPFIISIFKSNSYYG